MSSPVNTIYSGTFTSAATPVPVNVPLPSGMTKFTMYNITDMGSTAANNNVMQAYATSDMPVGGGIYTQKTSGAATFGTTTTLGANGGGFTFVYDSASTPLGGALAVTSATNASPIVLSMASTAGLNATGVVRYTDATGQLNVSGIDFTYNTLVANTSISLAYSPVPGAVGSGGNVQNVPFDPRYYPTWRYITAITNANPAVITLSVTHGYTVGQQVRIIVPSAFGMTQINNQLLTITAINTTTNTISVNIDSTNFTAFAYPSSATAALGVSWAIVVPVGEAAVNTTAMPFGNLLDDATVNTSFNGIIVGTTVQTGSKLYQWVAEKGLGT